MLADVEENLIDISRNSNIIDSEIENFLETNEGQNIKADIQLLNDMGFDKKMINKVYILLRPENIERAIDYMSERDGIYQHDFVTSNNPKDKLLCFICKKPKQYHLDYIPNDLLDDNNNINNNNHIELINHQHQNDIVEIEDNSWDKDKNEGECEVCYEEIKKEEKEKNTLPCGHLFCTHCWFNYLKTSILEAKVDNIECMNHECNEEVSEDFIMKHIFENQNLIEKYKKFKKRAEIIKDKNKKLCPKPDCDSFLLKSEKSKYVSCENGHTFCFECLKPPHGNKSCDSNLEKEFINWTKGKRVKRCPRCKMYTEKNEGCNHMTCASCKYQWCWLCEGKYFYGHYDSGRCKGQQFTKADNIKDIEKNRNYFGLHKIFSCFFSPVERRIELECCYKYLLIFGFWIFGVWITTFYGMIMYFDENIQDFYDEHEGLVFFFGFGIALGLLVSFQITFAGIITPFILISLVYPKFFDRLLLFFEVGND